MSRNYKFRTSQEVYFVSSAVVEWFDVFTSKEIVNAIKENSRESKKSFF